MKKVIKTQEATNKILSGECKCVFTQESMNTIVSKLNDVNRARDKGKNITEVTFNVPVTLINKE